MQTAPSLASRLIPLVLLLALLVLTATSAPAQTPAATVEDDSDTIVLQSFIDGALWVPGTFGTGTSPIEETGMRLMWAAFRAGRINGSHWDDGNCTVTDLTETSDRRSTATFGGISSL